jgi:transposase-like protein
MTKRQNPDAIYVKRQVDTEIIVLCVRWYITSRLSYRDLVAMMAERGVTVSHTTIMRWGIRYVPQFEKRWNRFVPGALTRRCDAQILDQTNAGGSEYS